jgi:tetratricopeptide (TPR) repeat protein
MPTILDMLDVPIPEFYQGRSFLELMFRQKRDKENIAYSETYYPRRHFGWSELKALYWKNWKYIKAPKEELYDLSQDTSETNNLIRFKSRQKEKLNREMQRFIQEKSITGLTAERRKSLNKEEIERLTALGYLTSVVKTTGKLDLPDPKDKIQVVIDLEKAKKHFDRENYDLAIPLIKAVVDSNPGVILAFHMLGNCYFQKEMYAKALENYRYVLLRQPDFIIVAYDVIECFSRMGKIDAAIKEAKKFLMIYPGDYTLLRKLASLYYSRRKYDQAIDILKKLYQMNKTDPEVLGLIVSVSIIREDFENARVYVERALDINPRLPQAHFLLGKIESAQGNSLKAIALYKEELTINPRNSQAVFYLAEELRLSGNYPTALSYYRKTVELDPGFNVPYFIIAKYLLMKNVQISEAIRLCKKGTEIEPKNQYTILGYSLLIQIYSKLGDSEKVDFYAAKAKKLQALLGQVIGQQE